MVPLENWLRVAGVFSVAACAALVIRLLTGRLYLRYRWLFCRFLAELILGAALLAIPMHRQLYAMVYCLVSPVLWTLTCLVVLELYSLIFEDRPGIASAARIFVGVSLLVATAISVAVFLLYAGPPPQRAAVWYLAVLQIDQSIHLAVFLFLAMMQLFLMRFPVPQRRNLTACTVGCTLYFGSGAGTMLIMAVTGASRTGRIIELILLFFSSLVLFVWAAALRRSGEDFPTRKRPWAPGEPEAVRAQLEAYDGILSRAGRIMQKKPEENTKISDAGLP